jgi:hypothetical protein
MVFKPANVISNDPIKCKPAVAMATPIRPSDNIATTSAEKLEKVVSAPSGVEIWLRLKKRHATTH